MTLKKKLKLPIMISKIGRRSNLKSPLTMIHLLSQNFKNKKRKKNKKKNMIFLRNKLIFILHPAKRLIKLIPLSKNIKWKNILKIILLKRLQIHNLLLILQAICQLLFRPIKVSKI